MAEPLGKFFLRALLCLLPALALWYWASAVMAWLPAQLAGAALAALFPGWCDGYLLRGTQLQLLTTIAAAGGPLTYHVNALIFCYGQPLLVALLLASRARRLYWKLSAGLLILLPLQVWGICFRLLFKVSDAGPAAYARTGFTQLDLNVFALAYQLGYLLLPPLGPVVVWLFMERRFVATELCAITPPAIAKPR